MDPAMSSAPAMLDLVPLLLMPISFRLTYANTRSARAIGPENRKMDLQPAGKLSDRFGSRIIASFGMLVIGLSFLALYMISPLTRTEILILLGTIGIGFGLFSAPNTNAVMSSVQRDNSGIASGFLGTMRFLGQLFSIVIATEIISSYIPRSLTVGMFSGTVVTITPEYFSSFTLGFRTVMLVSAVLSLLGTLASLIRNRGS